MHTETRPYLNESLGASLVMGVNTQIPQSGATLINSIAVVGGLFDKDYNLYDGDRATVIRALRVVKEAGITVHEAPQFQFYNLLAPLRNDFLHAAARNRRPFPADMLIVCGIWGGRSSRHTVDALPQFQRETPYENLGYSSRDEREVAISDMQGIEGAWNFAAQNAGVKLVITRGPSGIDAVNSEHFLENIGTEKSPFVRLIGTRENYEHVSGQIAGSLGILAHIGSLEGFKHMAKRNNLLGQRILAL